MRKEPTPEEKYAISIVRTVLGTTVDDTLEQRAPGQVDAELIYSDNHKAAVEVTTLCNESDRELSRLLRSERTAWRISDSSRYWTVSIPRLDLRVLDQYLVEAIELHEYYQVFSPDDRFPDTAVQASPALQYFRHHRINVWGLADATSDPQHPLRHPGAIRVRPNGRSGGGDYPNSIPTWLTAEAEVKASQIHKKVAKLARSGHEEQHLFLLVDLSAATFPFVWAVMDDEEVPDQDPILGDVTHLWLKSPWEPTYLIWEKGLGWNRRLLPQPHAPSTT
jgi:hypothetical protein